MSRATTSRNGRVPGPAAARQPQELLRRSAVKPVCVHRMIESQAERTPEGIALRCSGVSLSYEELNARANRLARHLRGLGVGPEVLVGLARRSAAMVAGLLAVLKAGGAYVPLDPAYPAERLAFMLDDARDSPSS